MIRTVDLSNDPRRSQFEYFLGFANPYASMTVHCDITHLRRVVREKGYPFFLTLLHCAVHALNDVPELRRRIRGTAVVEHDFCHSSHTVALPNGSYCYCRLLCDKPLEEFLPYARVEVERAKAEASLDDGDEAENLIFVTSVPWVSFTSISLPTPVPPDSNPRLTFGRFFEENGKVLLPVNLTVNHALADGIHIAKFFERFAARESAL